MSINKPTDRGKEKERERERERLREIDNAIVKIFPNLTWRGWSLKGVSCSIMKKKKKEKKKRRKKNKKKRKKKKED